MARKGTRDAIRLARKAGVATLTLDRPEKRNRLSAADLALLEARIEALKAEPAARVVVLTGAGDAVFCSGFDIGEIAATDWRANPLRRALRHLEEAPMPTICALNGSVYGAGVDLALACDLRIGVKGMHAAVPAARLGLMYYAAGLRRMVSRLGLGPAKRLLLAAEKMEADELLRVGFLDALYPREDFAAAVRARAAAIAELAPLAVAGLKQALNAIAAGSADDAEIDAMAAACFASADAAEGAAAFKARRKPRFVGR